MNKEEKFTNTDQSILKSMGHEVDGGEEKVSSRKSAALSPEQLEEIQQAQVATAPLVQEVKPRKENAVLTKLKSNFGLATIKTADVMLGDMNFTLKLTSASMLAWADALALDSVLGEDNKYLVAEYQARRVIYLAGVYVDAIDGQSLEDVFGENHRRLGHLKFISFLSGDSFPQLAQKIFDAYDKEIQSNAVVLSSLDSDKETEVYKCETCDHIEVYPREDAPYFCHKDGTKLRLFNKEDDVPLL